MKKKYLVVHQLNDFSGSPLVLSNFIEVLGQEGISVELLTSGEEGFLSRCRCPITEIPYRHYDNKIATLFSYLYSQIFIFVIVLARVIGPGVKDKPVLLVNTLLPFGAAIAAKLTSCRVMYYIHETSIRPALLKRWLKWVYNHTATDAIFVSSYLKEAEGVGDKCNINEVIVYNSFPAGHNPETKTKTSLKNDSFCVFMACSLKKYKGVYDFVQLACTKQLSDIKFMLALNSDPAEYNKFAQEYGHQHNLELHRRPKNIELLYQNASLVINLSHPDLWVETFGMTVIEAFSYGCPVIVPTVGGPAEVVHENMDGFKISVKNKSELIKKIRWLADNKEDYEGLAKNAIESAKRFDFGTYASEIRKCL